MLYQVQFLASRMATTLKRGSIVEADGVDNQSIAFPFAHRLSKPGRIWIRRMRAVHGDGPIGLVVLIKEVDKIRRLYDLESHGMNGGSRVAVGVGEIQSQNICVQGSFFSLQPP